MAIWTIAFIFCALAAVNASPNLIKTVNNTEKDITQENLFTDVRIVGDCDEIKNQTDKPIKIIITTDEVIYKCGRNVTSALSSHGNVLVMLLNFPTIQLISPDVQFQADLYLNRYYVIPERIRNIFQIIPSDNKDKIEAYVTVEAMTEQIFTLIRDEKYEEAVDLSRYQFGHYIESFKGTILPKLYVLLTQEEENRYKIMNYFYKFVQIYEIIPYNFLPPTLKLIFNGDTVRILPGGNLTIGSNLRLHNVMGSSEQLELIHDCTGSTDSDGYFKFKPYWNTTLNSVLFEIHNPKYDMSIRLHGDLPEAHIPFLSESDVPMAIAYRKSADPTGRFAWRIIPRFNEGGKLSFQVVSMLSDLYLATSNCLKEWVHVIGSSSPYNWTSESIQGLN